MTIDGLEIPGTLGSLEGFRTWAFSLGENAPRLHYYSGRVHVEMSPQNIYTHGNLVKAINRRLASLADEQDLGEYFDPPTLVTHEAAELSTEPDGFLVCWQTFTSGGATIDPARPTEVRGRPDWILEVVSQSSLKKDTVELRDAYARAGIGEYWLVDGRRERLEFSILLLDDAGAYREQPIGEDGWICSRAWGREFRIDRSMDPAGQVTYRLEPSPR